MATRRITTEEKTQLDQDDTNKPGQQSDITPAVPQAILAKLLAFTAAIFILPIASYFLTRNTLFKGNAGYAGAFAAFVANVVLIAYIIVAFLDDKAERAADEVEKKKSR